MDKAEKLIRLIVASAVVEKIRQNGMERIVSEGN